MLPCPFMQIRPIVFFFFNYTYNMTRAGTRYYICYTNLFCFIEYVSTRLTILAIDFFIKTFARMGKKLCIPENEFEEDLNA